MAGVVVDGSGMDVVVVDGPGMAGVEVDGLVVDGVEVDRLGVAGVQTGGWSCGGWCSYGYCGVCDLYVIQQPNIGRVRIYSYSNRMTMTEVAEYRGANYCLIDYVS